MSENWIGERWEIDEECTCLSVRVAGLIEPGARWRVATVGSAGRNKKDAQDVATARLIAAAPEMYEALRAVDAWENPSCFEKAKAALKKARGES